MELNLTYIRVVKLIENIFKTYYYNYKALAHSYTISDIVFSFVYIPISYFIVSYFFSF